MTVRKLAVHHSFPGRAEEETAARVVVAARGMGIEAKAVTGAGEIENFDPDLVLCLSHHEGKVTRYPTVGVMMAPLEWFAGDCDAIRRVLGYDGFLTLSASVRRWLEAAGVPRSRVAEYTNTVGLTDWVKPSFPPKLAYVGTNWDGWRHWETMRVLAQRPFMRFFGPSAAWAHIPRHAYGGQIPFDGISILNVYRNAGIGLALDRPDFAADDLPSNRIFEIAASGAVALASDIPLIRDAFGDAVLYIDPSVPPRALSWQIERHVRCIADNPDRAEEMSRRAHEVFRQRFALERLLPNVLNLHHECLRSSAVRDVKAPDCTAAGTSAGAEFAVDLTDDFGDGGCRAEAAVLMDCGELDLFLYPRDGRNGEAPQGRVVLDPGGIVDFARAGSVRMGDAWRFTFACARAPHGLGIRMELSSAPSWEMVCLALRGRRSGPMRSIAEAAAGRTVWVVGTGAGGRRVADALRCAGHPPAAFIDDLNPGPIDGLPVLRLADAVPVIGAEDCVVLASQHWVGQWARFSGTALIRLYTAHPGYCGEWLELPPPPAGIGGRSSTV